MKTKKIYRNKNDISKSAMKKHKLVNILKALTLRLIIIVHSVFLYLEVITLDCQYWYVLISLVIGVCLILAEGIYSIFRRLGQEWKWYLSKLVN